MATIELVDEQVEAIVRETLMYAYHYAPDEMKPHIDEVIKYYSSPAQVYEWECERGEG